MKKPMTIQLSSGIQPDSYPGTRSAHFPRPATLAVLLRLCRPAGFGFQKIRRARNAQRIFRTFRKCTSSVLGTGRLRPLGDPDTLRANPIPEDIPMNQISLIGIVESVPVTHRADAGAMYTSFRLRVHGSYLDRNSDAYSYTETYTVICVGKPEQFIRVPDILIPVEKTQGEPLQPHARKGAPHRFLDLPRRLRRRKAVRQGADLGDDVKLAAQAGIVQRAPQRRLAFAISGGGVQAVQPAGARHFQDLADGPVRGASRPVGHPVIQPELDRAEHQAGKGTQEMGRLIHSWMQHQ